MEIIKYNKSIIKPSYAKTLTRKEKDKLVEEFKKDCNNYYKKAAAFSYSMALWQAQDLNDNQIISDTLLGELLKLFDEGIEIPIEGSYREMEKELFDLMYVIRHKYEDRIKKSTLEIMRDDSYNRRQYYYTIHDNQYSLMDCINMNRESDKWKFAFITSSGTIEHRIDMYQHILSNMGELDLDDFLRYIENNWRDGSRKKRFNELNDYINNDTQVAWDTFSKIAIECDNVRIATSIQESGLLDFNRAMSEDLETPESYIRENVLSGDVNSKWIKMNLWIQLFNDLEDKSYDGVLKVRLLCHMVQQLIMYPEYVSHVLFNSKFAVNGAYGSFICDQILEYRKEITSEFPLDYYMKELDDGLKEKISHSKNKKEYRGNVACEKAFMKKYHQFIEERNRYKKELEEGRKIFTTQLHNLNENLQETTPGKKLLREIDFKKES